MDTPNADLMARARVSLKGKWGTAAAITFIWLLITGAPGAILHVSGIVNLIIGGPMLLGLYAFFLRIARGREAKVNQLFEGFSAFGVSVGAYILTLIFTLLWTMLLIVPGVIAALSYSMTFFIIADNTTIDALQAIRQSKAMMRTRKWKLFCLGCRFIGWAILGIASLGIGFLWIGPYMFASLAAFYQDLLDSVPGGVAGQGRPPTPGAV